MFKHNLNSQMHFFQLQLVLPFFPTSTNNVLENLFFFSIMKYGIKIIDVKIIKDNHKIRKKTFSILKRKHANFINFITLNSPSICSLFVYFSSPRSITSMNLTST